MKTCNLLSYDLGASNGRSVLGRFDGSRLTLEELNRFENNYVSKDGALHWDIHALSAHMRQALTKAAAYGQLHAFGIDTWGVDYGLLDASGALLGMPLCYRNSVEADVEPVFAIVPEETLFKRTGIASLHFNTIFQLYKRKQLHDPALQQAKTLLLIPDLLGYLLTGERCTEYTNATTTMLYDPHTKDWDRVTLDALGLPGGLFTPIDYPGHVRGQLKADIASAYGCNQAAFVSVGTHDTASAVAAIPGQGSFAFCSSGTWSLFGVETPAPVLTNEVFQAQFSNEGTVQGGFRPLKNIMGLWLIQACRRSWLKRDPGLSWDAIVQAAAQAAPLRSIIDPDDPAFFCTEDMQASIQAYCKKTSQPVPERIGEVARCIYESLALKYRWALERLEEIKGAHIASLNIVGGGSKNRLLNQMAADALGRPVYAGPVEGASMGNLLMQAVALGELGGIEDVREVVRQSIKVELYTPQPTRQWADAYETLLGLITQRQ